jgi:hypothetical protein
MTKLKIGHLMELFRFLVGATAFHLKFSRRNLGPNKLRILWVPRAVSWAKSSWDVKVITELHLVPRLRMRLYIKRFRVHPVVLVTIYVK